MNKFFKITGITIGSILVLFYIAFLFVLPNAVKLEKYKADIQKIVQEQTIFSPSPHICELRAFPKRNLWNSHHDYTSPQYQM